MFLEISQNSQENTCARVSFLIKLVFSCEFSKISKNTLFIEHLRETTSEQNYNEMKIFCLCWRGLFPHTQQKSQFSLKEYFTWKTNKAIPLASPKNIRQDQQVQRLPGQ